MANIRKRKNRKAPTVPTNPKAAGALVKGLQQVLDKWDNSKPERAEEKLFEAISALLDGGLVDLKEKELTLPGVLGSLFGHGSELAEKGESLERLISGYSESVEWDDMQDAYYVLEEIVAELQAWLRDYEPDPGPLFGDAHE
ncbi:MAG TPA: hypothetical protein VK788_24775 [Terriglobales bacterium]|nr:hypothetical protein [Terriglobales bacterium]